jgi:hypothetical protein
MKEKHAIRYAARNELLLSFGYRSYKKYLASDEWKKLRAEVFAEYPTCICCESQSQVVHHVRYDSATLLGVHRLNLAPLCHACHEKMEVLAGGEKATLAHANTLMFDMARKKNPKQQWLERFYRERKQWKSKSAVDAGARKQAWRRARDEAENQPRDYSGVFWIRARRR